MKITYVTTCKGRLHHLERTLPTALLQADAEWVVVDYGCPDRAGDWVQARYPQVRVVRVTDDPGFCAARARNLGAAAAKSPWIAFFDADVELAPDLFARLSPRLAPGHFFLPDSGDPNTWGSCLVERAAFLDVGGYDEAIDGWGGEDNDLYTALSIRGVQRSFYPGALVSPIRHSDEERTRFHASKSVPRATSVNAAYRALKFDVMRLVARPLAIEERLNLRQLARQLVEKAASAGAGDAAFRVQVTLPDRELRTRFTPPGRAAPRLRASIVYDLADYGEAPGTQAGAYAAGAADPSGDKP